MSKDWISRTAAGNSEPIDEAEIRRLAASGGLSRDHWICRRGETEWSRLGDALPGAFPPPLPDQPPPSEEDLAPGPPAPSLSSDLTSKVAGRGPVHPWRRYFAKSIDIVVCSFLVMLAIAIAVDILDNALGEQLVAFTENRLISTLIAFPLAMFPMAALVAGNGGSLGKWIFGIKVTSAAGRKLTFAEAVQREIKIWFRGFGLGIPIVSLFTLKTSFDALKQDKITAWDRDVGAEVAYRPDSTLQTVYSLIGVALYAVTLIGLYVWNGFEP